jgi:hypothetical protein
MGGTTDSSMDFISKAGMNSGWKLYLIKMQNDKGESP